MRTRLGWSGLTLLLPGLLWAAENPPTALHPQPYRKVVTDTAGMVQQPQAQALAQRQGLNILNLTWEDTGRFKDSSVGPNISDMTIQVQLQDPRTERFELFCMPVIRYPNFEDKSADLSPDKFQLLVGNEKGRPLRRVTLRQLLGDLRAYLHTPSSWKGKGTSLLAPRDSHVLVSAQACFLPVPRQGQATFNPVIFNYQSQAGDPAVLTLLATREGTSITVIDNKRDAFQAGGTWGQRLFFNQQGQRSCFTGQRLSDFNSGVPKRPGPAPSPEANEQQGLNLVLLVQVPLKQKRPPQRLLDGDMPAGGMVAEGASRTRRSKSDVEEAVIGHGRVEGPYTEVADLEIERDPRFPIRVTVQFYKATSNGVVGEADLKEIAAQIEKVYRNADYVGSLVTQGATGRPTEHAANQGTGPEWWGRFWERYQADTGRTPEETQRLLRRIHGDDWMPRNEAELAEAVRAAQAGPESNRARR